MTTLDARSSRTPARPPMGVRTLIPFFAFSFGITWGLGILAMVVPDTIERWFGPFGASNPLFIVAVYAPALTALALVWRHHGVRGLGSFLRRITLWRMPAPWWIGLALGIPAAYYLGAALSGTPAGFAATTWSAALPAVAFALLLGPVEELGWRGVALPLLQRRWAPLWAGLLLGAIWTVWHLPAFFIGGTPQSQFALGWFVVGGMAISVIMTATFNVSRGSLLVMALFHWQLNNPIWPDELGWASAAFVAAAVAIVVLRREAMLTRTGAVTTVLHPDDAAIAR